MAEREQDLDAAAGKLRHRRLIRQIWREWAAAGYWRGQHLQGLAASGDRLVLVDFYHREADRAREAFASWLARTDMHEIEQALYDARRRAGA